MPVQCCAIDNGSGATCFLGPGEQVAIESRCGGIYHLDSLLPEHLFHMWNNGMIWTVGYLEVLPVRGEWGLRCELWLVAVLEYVQDHLGWVQQSPIVQVVL